MCFLSGNSERTVVQQCFSFLGGPFPLSETILAATDLVCLSTELRFVGVPRLEQFNQVVAQENRILPSNVATPFIAPADLPALRSGNGFPPGLASLQVRVLRLRSFRA